jgi:hypothetical protein
MKRPNYEIDEKAFPAEAYTVEGYKGVAWRVYGWEIEPDEDTEWTGLEGRTGKIVCVMVGDDRRFVFDEYDVLPLADLDYCVECGQVGCTHDGRERAE